MRRIGRWIDFKNDYKTLDPTYMESVWWVFKQLWEKGLVYRGFKVSLHDVPTCNESFPQACQAAVLYAVQPQACPFKLFSAHRATCRSCLTPLVCPHLWPTSRPTRTIRTLWTQVSWSAPLSVSQKAGTVMLWTCSKAGGISQRLRHALCPVILGYLN